MAERKIVENDRELKSRQAAKRPRKKRRRLSAFGCALIVFFIIAVLGTFSAVFLIRIDTIAVSGETIYPTAQIISASGLKVGERMLLANRGTAASEICKKLPYVGQAQVLYRPFTGIEIRVSRNTVAYDIKFSGGYAAVDKNMEILETAKDSSKFGGIPVIEGVRLGAAVPGDRIPQDGRQQVLQAQAIMSGLKANNVNKIVSVDVTDSLQLHANYDGRIDILIGTSSDLSYKLRFAAYLLSDKNDISDTDRGLLDVSQSAEDNKVSFIPS